MFENIISRLIDNENKIKVLNLPQEDKTDIISTFESEILRVIYNLEEDYF